MSALVVFEAVEASHVALRLSHRPERSREFVRTLLSLIGTKEHHMFATIRRYDGVEPNRAIELTNKVNETLVPKLNELPGFVGYYLIEAGHGVFSSLSLFETREQAMESTKFVATWIREEKLDTILPNEPTITSGQVVAHSDRALVAA
jgi:hypothetical protein